MQFKQKSVSGLKTLNKLFLFSCDVINEFHKKVQEGNLSVA